jgi:hypothetical protein
LALRQDRAALQVLGDGTHGRILGGGLEPLEGQGGVAGLGVGVTGEHGPPAISRFAARGLEQRRGLFAALGAQIPDGQGVGQDRLPGRGDLCGDEVQCLTLQSLPRRRRAAQDLGLGLVDRTTDAVSAELPSFASPDQEVVGVADRFGCDR